MINEQTVRLLNAKGLNTFSNNTADSIDLVLIEKLVNNLLQRYPFEKTFEEKNRFVNHAIITCGVIKVGRWE